MKKKTLILGIGSSLQGDDGIGLYATRKLKDEFNHPAIDIIETEESGYRLLNFLEGYQRLIVIDSIDNYNTKSPILRLTQKDFQTKSRPISSHQMGIFELIKIGKSLGLSLPSRVIIYAIPIKKQNRFKLAISKRMGGVITKLTKLVKKEVAIWQ